MKRTGSKEQVKPTSWRFKIAYTPPKPSSMSRSFDCGNSIGVIVDDDVGCGVSELLEAIRPHVS